MRIRASSSRACWLLPLFFAAARLHSGAQQLPNACAALSAVSVPEQDRPTLDDVRAAGVVLPGIRILRLQDERHAESKRSVMEKACTTATIRCTSCRRGLASLPSWVFFEPACRPPRLELRNQLLREELRTRGMSIAKCWCSQWSMPTGRVYAGICHWRGNFYVNTVAG